MNSFLEALNHRVLVFDGAMGTAVQAMNLSAADYGGKEGANDYIVQTRPDIILGIHRDFMKAGADVLETSTFQSTRLKLGEYGLADITHKQNVDAARLARRAADEFSTPAQPRFVAGSMGPTGMLPSTDDPMLGKITFDELAELFREQAAGLIEGGVDALLIETAQDLLEVKAAVAGARRAIREAGRAVAIMTQVSLDMTGRMLLGNDIGAVYWTLDALGVDVIGMNCSTGPDYMRDAVRYLCTSGRLPVSCIPNAGLPLNVGGRAVYPMKPEPFAELLGEFVHEYGVNLIGGCCGTTCDHIARLVAVARGARPRTRWLGRPREPRLVFAASAMKAVALKQDQTVTIIGERLNAQGSRKVKDLMLAGKYGDLVPIAREQVEGGAHFLDVCTALTERADEAEQMRRIVKLLAQSVDAPLVVDSTEPPVIEAALKQYPGAAVVNAINLENGRERIDQVLPLVIAHGASVIALTIDKSIGGMAKTRAAKLEVARRIHDIACNEFGLEPGRLVFDALTFTLATGEEEFKPSAVETIEGIRAIKRELPGVLTTLGVSNVSFGLSKGARPVVNSVFLHHCREAGLDTAIINAAQITPYFEIAAAERDLADDLILNRRPDALERLIAHFEGKGETPVAAVREDEIAWEDPAALRTELHQKILHRRPKDAPEIVEALITRHRCDPVDVLNNTLLPAMKEVGDKFGSGELILPFVLQSAEVMKKCVAALEKYLDRIEGATKGKVVLATVFGDVHDIGKNLVNTILSNNGYTVYDLGKQVPVQTIIAKAQEVGADAIGLSALLVSTSKQMPICVRELHHQKLAFPVIVGGAAINRSYGRRISFVSDDAQDDAQFAPGVFYAKDAFEGLSIMDRLMGSDRAAFVDGICADALQQRRLEREHAAATATDSTPRRSRVAPLAQLPEPPFRGWRVLRDVPLPEVWRHLDLTELFRVGWGAKGKRGEEYDALLATDFRPRLEAMQRDLLRTGILQPAVIYGYFPVQGDGDDLIVYDPADPARELVTFTFPRQARDEFLCLADYAAPKSAGRMDWLCAQVVTVGPRPTEECDRLNAAGDYAAAYFLHGLATESAEALAAWNHARIREEWKLEAGRGKRYSFGYSACPDLADQQKLFRLLPAERELGTRLTDHHQIVPEQSTSAVIFHHPEATYYVV